MDHVPYIVPLKKDIKGAPLRGNEEVIPSHSSPSPHCLLSSLHPLPFYHTHHTMESYPTPPPSPPPGYLSMPVNHTNWSPTQIMINTHMTQLSTKALMATFSPYKHGSPKRFNIFNDHISVVQFQLYQFWNLLLKVYQGQNPLQTVLIQKYHLLEHHQEMKDIGAALIQHLFGQEAGLQELLDTFEGWVDGKMKWIRKVHHGQFLIPLQDDLPLEADWISKIEGDDFFDGLQYNLFDAFYVKNPL